MRRAPRGLDTPAGTLGQEVAAVKAFNEFLESAELSSESLDMMHSSISEHSSLPMQNFYSLLTAFSIFLQTKKSGKARAVDGFLAKATALGYFSQIVNLLRERYQGDLSDSKRIANIRDKMASSIEERNLRANIQTNDAPGCTITDLCVLVEHFVVHGDVATGLKSVHDAALLTMMWHTFGRAIDTCFARKQQLSLAASGELFLRIARIKTSVVQGVSIFKAPERWQQCMLHAFGVLFMCYDEPSEYLFPLVPRYAESDLPGGQTYTQEEAVIYWENLQSGIDSEQQPAAKWERKRPNIASYITEVTRDTLKMMSPSQQQAMTPNLTSHSLRRGAAAYANASPKLAIQWISTKGAWLLESLTKAFAHIGTTTREDQSVGKVLAGYQSPDLPVMTPTIADLQQRLSIAEYGQLFTLRDELFQHVLGSPDPRYNVFIAVVDATFAAMLMHMKSVLESCRAICAPTTRYEYQLHRAIAATNARLGCHISTATCFSWGDHLTARWQTANHAQVSSAATGGDSLLASTLENILKQLAQINDRLARLEDTAHKSPVTASETSTFGVSEVPLLSVPAPATASTLAGCVLNWFTNSIWETVKGKREQNKRAEAKAAINIMLILYQTPCTITKPPPRADAAEYQVWKKTLWDLALALDRTANERLRSIDGRKSSTKASSLRKRWRELRASHPAAYQSLGAQFLSLKASGAILDLCTPPSHQWSVSELA